MLRSFALLVVALAMTASAAPSITPNIITLLGVAPTTSETHPVVLSKSTDGDTAINRNGTGTESRVTGAIVPFTNTANTTVITNPTSATWRVRFVHVGALNGTALSECRECSMRLVRGSETYAQILITNGASTRTTGEWVQLNPAGQAGSKVWLRATTGATGLATSSYEELYRMEIEAVSGSTVTARYTNMSMIFTV